MGGEGGITIPHDPPASILDGAEVGRPAGEVGEVEAEVVVFGQRIEVGGVEFEEVEGGEGAEGGHGRWLRTVSVAEC